MNTLKEQTDAKVEMGRKSNPNFMKGVDDIIADAKRSKKDRNAILVGGKVEDFSLEDQNGILVSLYKLLEKGPVVVTFYRGSWCPYCNLQLKALHSYLDEIHNLGAQLLAISPEVPDKSLSKSEINEMKFKVLSDQDSKVASKYGIAWEIPEFLSSHMKIDRGLDLEVINNGNANVIPIPATFVIGCDGNVKWSYVDLDYRKRSEPIDIITVLKELI